MRPFPPFCAVLLLAALAAGCGDHRAEGDPGGVPVAFSVRLDWAFVSEYHRNAPAFVGGGFAGFHNHGPYGHHPIGFRDPWDPWWGGGFAEEPGGTTATLLAGDAPSQGQLFRRRLRFGDNRFAVPVRAGRTVALTFQVDGDYQGWETVGSFVAADRPGQVVTVSLTADGVKLTVEPPAEAAPPASAPADAPAAP